MRDIGNTLIVVEHDEDTMMAADYLIDIGPGAGVHGGASRFCWHTCRGDEGSRIINRSIFSREEVYSASTERTVNG